MTNRATLFGACALVILAAFLLFASMRQWIIIRGPQQYRAPQQEYSITKKKGAIWFWRNGVWYTENIELIWSKSMNQNIIQVMSKLLTVFEEEQLITKKTTLQSVAINKKGTIAYLSFDRTPFDKHTTIYNKWMTIEGILKTLHENGVTIQNIQFLTHHKPMYDLHLDFSHPWPIQGFSQQNKN